MKKTYPSNEGWITAILKISRPIQRDDVIQFLGDGLELEVAVYKVYKKTIRVTYRIVREAKVIESPEDIRL